MRMQAFILEFSTSSYYSRKRISISRDGTGGRLSLALDLMEELRPVLADRFVLTLINRKMVNKKDFSRKEDGAVIMRDEARKLLLSEWQNKKKEMITHPYLNEKVEWGMIPFVQAMLLSRFLRGDIDEYPPFFWK